MAQKNNHLVIMAGGVGSRFWPMSTAEKPKQFIDVLGVGKTLLQLTVERFNKLVSPENIWVVTNQKYVDIVREQLPEMPAGNILCEPCRRNTAPCIAYVSWRIKSKDPKANIVVTPSDHIVMNVQEFQRVITECMNFTAESDALIVKGLIALLLRVLSGHTPQEILDADLYFIDEIGLRDHLSPTRSNGLLAMVKQIRVYALAYKTQEDA